MRWQIAIGMGDVLHLGAAISNQAPQDAWLLIAALRCFYGK